MSLPAVIVSDDVRYILQREQDTNPPVPPNGKFWIVRGDEELQEYDYRSRTLADNWGYLKQTPSVFRWDRNPVDPANDYRVDITPFLADIDRINNWTDGDNHRAYLFSGGTALFNNDTFPRQQYLTMSFNLLQEIEVLGNFLKFKTLTPDSYTAHLTRETHPQFVHKWDIVSGKMVGGKAETYHTETPHGKLYWLPCSKEGYGYIHLRLVRRAQ